MTDIRRPPTSEIAALRRELAELRAEVISLRRQRQVSGDDAPHGFRAHLRSALEQGGEALADFYEWSKTETAWVLVAKDVPVREFTLNTGERYGVGYKGWATWDRGGVWVFATDACYADNTGLGGGQTPPAGSQTLLGHAPQAAWAELAAETAGEASPGPFDHLLIPT